MMTFIKRRIIGPFRFLPIYLWMLTLSNLRVAFDVLRPNPKFNPGFVELDLSGYTDLERWAASCLISMTPGTLAVDLPEGSDHLVVHCLYFEDEASVLAELRSLLQSAFGSPGNSNESQP